MFTSGICETDDGRKVVQARLRYSFSHHCRKYISRVEETARKILREGKAIALANDLPVECIPISFFYTYCSLVWSGLCSQHFGLGFSSAHRELQFLNVMQDTPTICNALPSKHCPLAVLKTHDTERMCSLTKLFTSICTRSIVFRSLH